MRLRLLTYLILALMPLLSCRTNGGEIGLLYGQWALRAYTIDGEEAEGVDIDNFYWMFQGTVVSIIETLPLQQVNTYFGTFEHVDKTLTLNFTHTNANEESVGIFNPPAELGLPERSIIEMSVIKLTIRDLMLKYTDTDGVVKIYTFEKLN